MDDEVRSKFAWSITGSGHYLKECMDLMQRLGNVDLFLSRAASEVLSMYGFDSQSLKPRIRVFRDNTASAVPVGFFYERHYHTVVIAPATSNTVAKCVGGISDTLVTNIFAQAGKCRVPSIIFACDTEPALISEAPGGPVMVYPRQIDLENVEKLRTFESTTVASSIDELERALEMRMQCLSTSCS